MVEFLPLLIKGAEVAFGVSQSNKGSKAAANFANDASGNGQKVYDAFNDLVLDRTPPSHWTGLLTGADKAAIQSGIDQIVAQVAQNPYVYNHDGTSYTSRYARTSDGQPMSFTFNNRPVAQLIDAYLDQKKAGMGGQLIAGQPSTASSSSVVKGLEEVAQRYQSFELPKSSQDKTVFYVLGGVGALVLLILLIRK